MVKIMTRDPIGWMRDEYNKLVDANLNWRIRELQGPSTPLAKIDGKEVIIAGSRYIMMTDPSVTPLRAEVAFTVEEDYQGQGLAGRLFEQLVDIARSKGVSTFEAEILPQNRAMLAVFAGRGLPMKKAMVDGLVHVTLSLS